MKNAPKDRKQYVEMVVLREVLEFFQVRSQDGRVLPVVYFSVDWCSGLVRTEKHGGQSEFIGGVVKLEGRAQAKNDIILQSATSTSLCRIRYPLL